MKRRKIELDVDCIGDQAKSLRADEEIAISLFINKLKEKRQHRLDIRKSSKPSKKVVRKAGNQSA